MTRRSRILTHVALLILLSMLASGCYWIERVSFASGGLASSVVFDISVDGRFVLFSTFSPEVPADTNGLFDLYRRDTLTDTVDLVSTAQAGGAANGTSYYGRMSDNGRYVVFDSVATDLVSGDANGVSDVFVRDLQQATTVLISKHTNGTQGNGPSTFPDISADGSRAAFQSTATNLVDGDANGFGDVFVRNAAAGTTVVVSTDGAGNPSNGQSGLPQLNGDGSRISFSSGANNLVVGDGNFKNDIFVKADTGFIEIASLTDSGGQADGDSVFSSLNHAGDIVAFDSTASNLVPGMPPETTTAVAVRHLGLDTTVVASVMPDGSPVVGTATLPRLSNSGLQLTFAAEERSVVRDLDTGTSHFASVRLDGTVVEGGVVVISGDGRYAGLTSDRALVTDDTNGNIDAYVVAWREPQVTSISHPTIASGTTESITLTGTNFEPGANLINFAGQLSFANVTVQSSTQITADMTAVGPASAQLWNILIQNPNGGPGSGSGSSGPCSCVTIT